jgi:hypothetical protein
VFGAVLGVANATGARRIDLVIAISLGIGLAVSSSYLAALLWIIFAAFVGAVIVGAVIRWLTT